MPSSDDKKNESIQKSKQVKKQQLYNQQTLNKKFLDKRKILRDMLTSRSIAVLIENMLKRLSKEIYQQTLIAFIVEKIFGKRRRRSQVIQDPTGLGKAFERVVSMLKPSEPSTPKPSPAIRPKKKRNPLLVFSKMASFMKKPFRTKPTPEHSGKTRGVETPVQGETRSTSPPRKSSP